MNKPKVTFIALTSVLATSCGTDSETKAVQEKNPASVKAQIHKAKINVEEVSKVGFTEIEVSE